jgi:hypothetical protein
MGVQLEQTPAMGEYMVEVRRESFYLQGTGKRHGLILYPDVDNSDTGVVEILIEDIPKIRAALDAVGQYIART